MSNDLTSVSDMSAEKSTDLSELSPEGIRDIVNLAKVVLNDASVTGFSEYFERVRDVQHCKDFLSNIIFGDGDYYYVNPCLKVCKVDQLDNDIEMKGLSVFVLSLSYKPFRNCGIEVEFNNESGSISRVSFVEFTEDVDKNRGISGRKNVLSMSYKGQFNSIHKYQVDFWSDYNRSHVNYPMLGTSVNLPVAV